MEVTVSDIPGVTLYHGDCMDVLRQLPAGSVDAVVTDPPYGIAHASHGGRFRRAKRIAGDDSLALAAAVYRWCKAGAVPLAMFFSPYRPPRTKWRSVLVWDKGAHVGIGGDRRTCWKRDFELLGVAFNRPLNGKRDSAVLAYPALLPPPTGHVAEKPVRLMRYLVQKLTRPGGTVFDPFMGGGTTGVACLQTGRRFIGCEISPEYFAVAEKRIRAAADDGLFRDAAPTQAELFDEAQP